jgi:hypothetical protein
MRDAIRSRKYPIYVTAWSNKHCAMKVTIDPGKDTPEKHAIVVEIMDLMVKLVTSGKKK